MTKDIPRALGNEDPNLPPLLSWAGIQKCPDSTLDTLKSAVMDPFSQFVQSPIEIDVLLLLIIKS